MEAKKGKLWAHIFRYHPTLIFVGPQFAESIVTRAIDRLATSLKWYCKCACVLGCTKLTWHLAIRLLSAGFLHVEIHVRCACRKIYKHLDTSEVAIN